MANKILRVLRIDICKEKTITEVGPKSGSFIDENGRRVYGSMDVTGEMSLDELKELRDFIDEKLKKRIA